MKKKLASIVSAALTLLITITPATQAFATETGGEDTLAEVGKAEVQDGLQNDGNSSDDNDSSGEGTQTEKKTVAKIGENEYESLEEAINAINSDSTNNTIELLDDIEITGQIKIEKQINLEGNNHTITANNTDWSTDDNSKYMLLITADSVQIENLIFDGNDQASMGVQFYKVTDGAIKNLTVKNTKGLGLNINASSVSATDKLELLNNGWGSIINVSWGKNISDVNKCSFDASEAELVGVDLIYYDNSDVTNAGNDQTEKFEIKMPDTGWAKILDSEKEALKVAGGHARAAASIGETNYATLAGAVESVEADGEIKLLRDSEGCGIGTFLDDKEVKKTKVKNFTIDFDGHIYTCNGTPAVGSAGYESQAFHLEWNGAENEKVKVTLKNGTIDVKEGASSVKMLVQNYCDLTLDNMTLDGTNLAGTGRYTLSNNCGNITIKDTTIIARDDGYAFDMYYWPKNGYTNGVQVTVSGDSVIKGTVEISHDSDEKTTAQTAAEKCRLTIQGGTFEKEISFANQDYSDELKAQILCITGGKFSFDPTAYVDKETKVQKSKDGKYFLVGDDAIGADAASTNTSSGGSGSSTKIVKNEDGSTTAIKKLADGTVREETRKKDGSVVTVDTKKDGSVTTTNKAADGTTGTIVTDAAGVVTDMRTEFSAKTAAQAAETGNALTLPITLTASASSEQAATVKISAKTNAEILKVEIPVQDTTNNTVIIDAKTGKIIKTAVLTENGIMLKLDGQALADGAELKVVNNAKNLPDAQNHWAKDSIDFVTSREIFNGTSKDKFTPEGAMTRMSLMTVLARLENGDDANAVEWAKQKGISDGSNPNAEINREQLVTMLYRYVGTPEVEGSFDNFADAGKVSNYAADAMAWATQTGLISGTGNGSLAPQGGATRAQTATIIMRFCESIVK